MTTDPFEEARENGRRFREHLGTPRVYNVDSNGQGLTPVQPDPFEFLAQVELTEEETGIDLFRIPTGFELFTTTMRHVQAVAALVAPPGHKVEAMNVVRDLMTQRAARYQPPQSAALNPEVEPQ